MSGNAYGLEELGGWEGVEKGTAAAMGSMKEEGDGMGHVE